MKARWIAHYECSNCGEHSSTRKLECPFCHASMSNNGRRVSRNQFYRFADYVKKEFGLTVVPKKAETPTTFKTLYCDADSKYYFGSQDVDNDR